MQKENVHVRLRVELAAEADKAQVASALNFSSPGAIASPTAKDIRQYRNDFCSRLSNIEDAIQKDCG
ncbi:MAG: hypothetical protein AAB403_01875 [Planctomycetota bacterium]